MAILYFIAAILILGGAVTAWVGPDLGSCEDGTPFPTEEKRWVRIFGFSLVFCGVGVVVALLGFLTG